MSHYTLLVTLRASYTHTHHGVEDFEEREAMNQLLDSRDHPRQQDQEKEDVAEHENQIVHPHPAYMKR